MIGKQLEQTELLVELRTAVSGCSGPKKKPEPGVPFKGAIGKVVQLLN